jgi:hypothetical protein
MKSLGVLESKWDLIRQKLVSHLLEEQEGFMVLLCTERRISKSKGGRDSGQGSGTCQAGHVCLKGDQRVYLDPR